MFVWSMNFTVTGFYKQTTTKADKSRSEKFDINDEISQCVTNCLWTLNTKLDSITLMTLNYVNCKYIVTVDFFLYFALSTTARQGSLWHFDINDSHAFKSGKYTTKRKNHFTRMYRRGEAVTKNPRANKCE